MAAYSAGQCNIGTAESRSRRLSGIMWTVAYVASLAALLLLEMPKYSRLVTFLPLFLAIMSFWQAQQKFCVMYAAGGIYNMSETDIGATTKIMNNQFLRADRLRALRIGLISALVAAVVTAVLYFL